MFFSPIEESSLYFLVWLTIFFTRTSSRKVIFFISCVTEGIILELIFYLELDSVMTNVLMLLYNNVALLILLNLNYKCQRRSFAFFVFIILMYCQLALMFLFYLFHYCFAGFSSPSLFQLLSQRKWWRFYQEYGLIWLQCCFSLLFSQDYTETRT